VEDCDDNDRQPLYWACVGGHVEMAYFLLDFGAAINEAGGETATTALHVVCAQGLVEVVRLLLSRGADAALRDNHGGTALMGASQQGHVMVVETMLTFNRVIPTINHLDHQGQSALFLACQAGHARVVKALLDAGADPWEGRSSHKLLPLHAALRCGHDDCVKLIQGGD